MTMNNKILLFFLVAVQGNLLAQPTFFHQAAALGPYIENPNPNYSNWQKQSSQSDDFASQIDLTKWNPIDRPPCSLPGICCNYTPHNWDQPENLSIQSDPLASSDVLNIKLDLCTPNNVCFSPTYSANCVWANYNYYFTTGGIQSVNANYNYGYYEASIKLPGWYYNGAATGDGFHPAFWLYASHSGCAKNEVDIMEPGGLQYANANFNEGGFWDYKKSCWGTACTTNSNCGFCSLTEYGMELKVGRAQITTSDPLFLNYHNYAVEYMPDRIIFYLDNKPYSWFLNPNCQAPNSSAEITHAFQSQPMYVVFNNQTDYMPGFAGGPADGSNFGIPMPNNPPSWGDDNTAMKVDYFYYWKLKLDCSKNEIIYSTSDLNTFYYAVKKTILFNGVISTALTAPLNNLTFRATDEIEVLPGFDTSYGSTLNLEISTCN